MDIHSIILPWFIILFTGHYTSSFPLDSLPIYNPTTRCHDLTYPEENLTFAICLQRASNKQHPYNLYTSPSFCTINYSPSAHLIDFNNLSSSTISRVFRSLIALLNSRNSYIDYPEPNFLWINSNLTQNLINQSFWCSQSCQMSNSSGKFFILRLRCPATNNNQPCLTTKQTHWDRAPFICQINQIVEQKISHKPSTIHISPIYSNNTIVFTDSTPCVIVRTTTHQYSFCFRRQLCSQSQTSAFCTNRFDAQDICRREKNGSNLLTIENEDEYQLINDVISLYSNETLLDNDGLIKNQYIQRAQWMWIDGLRSSETFYGWNIYDDHLTEIDEKYWCDNHFNCTGGKGRDHVVLNIVCQTNEKHSQICLASRRQSEPGPFICKRILKDNEIPVANYTYLRNVITPSVPASVIIPVYEKNLTSIYYDEHHCLTAQTRTYLYTFCLRRQECIPRKAYCTKWSQAQNDCQQLKNHSQLLTIDNDDERKLITDILDNYHYETRLTFNGSSYRYFLLADFIWIDGIQQKDNHSYLWKNGLETIPNHLWCSRNECNSMDRPRVMINLLCQRNNSPICLGSRLEWKPAPYICKRPRPIDICPILFDEVRIIKWNEMLVITVNRTMALIKCKFPEYNTEIKVQYECNIQTKQWELIYENDNFICPDEGYPSTIVPMERSSSTRKTITQPSTPTSYTSPSAIQEYDCSPSDLLRIINYLPTNSRYVYSQRTPFSSASYYNVRLICHYNTLIQITYRCDLSTRQYIYVYGNSNNFRQCVPRCNDEERKNLLNKYFSPYQQRDIRASFNERDHFIRYSCFDSNEYQWKSIDYQCGTMTITKDQWYRIHSCFQLTRLTTSTTTPLPTVMVSMSITQVNPSCPPSVIRGSQCEYQQGEYIVDKNGCTRKICPSLSHLCQTIRCPPDRICRVILCRSCLYTDYLQAVCEYSKEQTLCQFEQHISMLNSFESIDRWERETLALVQRYASEKRQRLRSPWPVLTAN